MLTTHLVLAHTLPPPPGLYPYLKSRIEPIVVSTTCGESGLSKVYPSTSEAESVTQGTKEQFAKRIVTGGGFPIFFFSGGISGTHVLPLERHEIVSWSQRLRIVGNPPRRRHFESTKIGFECARSMAQPSHCSASSGSSQHGYKVWVIICTTGYAPTTDMLRPLHVSVIQNTFTKEA